MLSTRFYNLGVYSNAAFVLYRYMFWADAATDQYAGKIVRASMDGSNAVIIATGTGIEVPTTLAIDYQGKHFSL